MVNLIKIFKLFLIPSLYIFPQLMSSDYIKNKKNFKYLIFLFFNDILKENGVKKWKKKNLKKKFAPYVLTKIIVILF